VAQYNRFTGLEARIVPLMLDLIQRALAAKRESKYIEFKDTFDPNSARDWCGIVKDIVAIANSGGGIILFGLDSSGAPTATPVAAVASIDPADVGNRVSKYTGPVQLEFDTRELEKGGKKLHAFLVHAVSVPIVFQKPGTYDIGSGKQKTEFSVGTVYFRHGAKSEPGNSDDIRAVIERQLESIRKSWIKGVRKVVQAPQGSQIITVPATGHLGAGPSPTLRAVKDPKATPVLLTRDRQKATGTLVHEDVSESIFDEINNVIDANRILAGGQLHFFFGLPIYYRIYAERQYVVQRDDNLYLLLRSAVCDLNAPALFWALALPETAVAETFADVYLHPKTPFIYSLIRFAVLLGIEFCDWLYERWHRKWKRHPQPPQFYFAFKEMKTHLAAMDPRLAAARVKSGAQFEIDKVSIGAAELMENPQKTMALLSTACMRVFEGGDSSVRSTVKSLDYLAYGLQIHERAAPIAGAIMEAIGNQEAADLAAETAEE
jgi:hypothetical protein